MRRPPARYEALGVETTADHERRDHDAPENSRMKDLRDG
jgi:hypothetical protein